MILRTCCFDSARLFLILTRHVSDSLHPHLSVPLFSSLFSPPLSTPWHIADARDESIDHKIQSWQYACSIACKREILFLLSFVSFFLFLLLLPLSVSSTILIPDSLGFSLFFLLPVFRLHLPALIIWLLSFDTLPFEQNKHWC